MEARTILFEAIVDFADEQGQLTICANNLLREYADWVESVGADRINQEGEIGLPSGMMKWRVKE